MESHRIKKFACDKCDKSYGAKKYLKVHHEAVHSGKRFPCDKCDKTFARHFSLVQHVKEIHTLLKVSCDFCSKQFSSKSNLKRHIVIVHLNLRPYSCHKCERTFKKKAYLKNHLQTQHSAHQEEVTKVTPSKESGYYFSDDEEMPAMVFRFQPDPPLESMESIVNQNPDPESIDQHKPVKLDSSAHVLSLFKCDVCDKSFSLRSHRELHAKKCKKSATIKPYQCGICSLAFAKPEELTKHVEDSHLKTKSRPSCNICDKTFSNVTVMKTHYRALHLGERQFKCNLCDKIYRRKDNLKIHKLNNHSNVPQACKVCGKIFGQKYLLKTHMQKSHSDLQVQCPHCKKLYASKHILKTHVKTIHEKTMQFPCRICTKPFTQDLALRKHMAKIHGITEPFQCDSCDSKFSKRLALKTHRRRVHKLP